MRRRQELRELRLLQKEEHRALALLNTKLDAQKDHMQRRFDQEMNVRHTQIYQTHTEIQYTHTDTVDTQIQYTHTDTSDTHKDTVHTHTDTIDTHTHTDAVQTQSCPAVHRRLLPNPHMRPPPSSQVLATSLSRVFDRSCQQMCQTRALRGETIEPRAPASHWSIPIRGSPT